jgi:hypothetical protein
MTSIASSAFAEWTRIGNTDQAIEYIDYATIRRNGALGRIWTLHDLKVRVADFPSGTMSIRTLTEFDCAQERSRSLSNSAHSGAMATGRSLLVVTTAGEWNYIAPGTVDDGVRKIVCAR